MEVQVCAEIWISKMIDGFAGLLRSMLVRCPKCSHDRRGPECSIFRMRLAPPPWFDPCVSILTTIYPATEPDCFGRSERLPEDRR